MKTKRDSQSARVRGHFVARAGKRRPEKTESWKSWKTLRSRFLRRCRSLPSPRPFIARKTNSLCGSVPSFFSFLLLVVGKNASISFIFATFLSITCFLISFLSFLSQKKSEKNDQPLWFSTKNRTSSSTTVYQSHHPSRDKNATTMDDEFIDVTSARSSSSKSSFSPSSSSSRRKISLNTTTLLALNLVQNKKLEENTTTEEQQQQQQQKTKKKSDRSAERTKTGSDTTRGGFRAPPTTLSKDETNRHQRSSLLSELSGEARLLERRRRREQRNEERKQRIEERINNASPKKSTTANRLDPLAWRSLEGMVGGRVYQPQDRIVHRKKRVEVTEISTPRKGRRPWSMKNDDTHLKICMYAAAKTTKVPSPSSSKTTYTKGPMFALLQPTLVV